MSCCKLQGAMLRSSCWLTWVVEPHIRLLPRLPLTKAHLKSVQSSRYLGSAVFWPKLRLAYCGAGPEHRLPAPGCLACLLSPPAGSLCPTLPVASTARTESATEWTFTSRKAESCCSSVPREQHQVLQNRTGHTCIYFLDALTSLELNPV